MTNTGEEIHQKGKEYLMFVDSYISSFSKIADRYPIWNCIGHAYNSPHLVTILIDNGNEVHFDLSYISKSLEFDEPVIQMYVEAKGSYDKNYVKREFSKFISNLYKLKNILIEEKWKKTHFLFVSPITPPQIPNMEKILNIIEIKKLFNNCSILSIPDDDPFFQSICSRIHILQLPYENKILIIGANENAP